MTDRRDALVSLAVAARARSPSPATSLGLRLCGVVEDGGADDFDADAPTSPDLAVRALEGGEVELSQQSQGSASPPDDQGER